MGTQEPSLPNNLITFEDFNMLLDVGWKLCEEHCLMQDPLSRDGKDKSYWKVCFASLPKDLDVHVRQDGFGKLFGGGLVAGRDISLARNVPGHRWVAIASSTDTDKYFHNLLSKVAYVGTDRPRDPDYFLRTVERAFIRLDVAKFSQFPACIQPLVIADIQEVAKMEIERTKALGHLPEVFHTGDGFILAYKWDGKPDNNWLPATASRIAAKLDMRNDDKSRIQVHFRMSVTLGQVYLTKDLLGRPNYAGEAITETERLIYCMPSTLDDLVYISDPVYREHRDYLLDRVSRLGSAPDKHGVHHRLYSLEYLEDTLGDS